MSKQLKIASRIGFYKSAAASLLVFALADVASPAQAFDYHQDTNSNDSLANTVRSVEGIYCGVECTAAAQKRWTHERHTSVSAAHGDWFGLNQSNQ